ncbi:hypothetical protein F4861DRAFT_528646 [Xylaria intraflava]|nr:hypothetical protein F4861DRAFT_528646 [Xylaria intraflava]
MTLLAWSLILASTVYIAIRRRTLIKTLVALWRPSLAPRPPPSTRSLSTADVDALEDGASDRAATSAVSIANQDASVKRVKAATDVATDRNPIPIVPPSASLEIDVKTPVETVTPLTLIESSPPPSPQTTPKAGRPTPPANGNDIPSFALSHPTSTADASTSVATPALAAVTATTTVTTAASLAAPATLSAKSPATLMPPPPPRPPKLNKVSNSSLLGVPSPRPSPLPNRQQAQYDRQPGTSTLAPAPTQTRNQNSSRKVTLEPGHSPLDWARLANHPTADLRGLGPNTSYLRVTPSMLKRQTGRRGKDAWTALGGRVYNITPYLPFHPGGEPELLRAAGRDGTKLFAEIHPWVNYETMLSSCLIGLLVDEAEAQGTGDMEAMD